MQVDGCNTGEGLIFECSSTRGRCGMLHLEQIITGFYVHISVHHKSMYLKDQRDAVL